MFSLVHCASMLLGEVLLLTFDWLTVVPPSSHVENAFHSHPF